MVDHGDIYVTVWEEVPRQVLPEPLVVVNVLGRRALDRVSLSQKWSL